MLMCTFLLHGQKIFNYLLTLLDWVCDICNLLLLLLTKKRLGYLRRKQRPQIQQTDENYVDDDGVEEIELAPGITHYVCPTVYLAPFPVMVGSILCRLQGLPTEQLIEMGELIHEPFGMFLMRGKERILVPQKNMTKNMLYVDIETPAGQNDNNSSRLIIRLFFYFFLQKLKVIK